jgi:hypothetical protein
MKRMVWINQIRTFNHMKKVFQIMILMMVGLLIGCGPTYYAVENQIIITVPSDLVEHMPYDDEVLPKFIYSFEGSRNIASHSAEHMIILTKNDDFIVSNEIESILNEYESKSLITKRNEQAAERNIARLGGQEFIITEPSYEYWHILYLEDGSRLSMEYRRFTSEGKIYYGWTYSSGITMKLELPLMVRQEMINSGTKKVFYLLPLPFQVKYELSNNISVKRLLSNDDYVMNQSWYTFSYPEDIEEALTKNEKIEYIKQWYNQYCFGRMIGEDYVITYLGYDFMINFDTMRFHKALNRQADAFELIFVGKSS